MSVIKVSCVDQTLTCTNTPLIASGGIEENHVEFTFCSQWDNHTKTAVFWRDEDNPYSQILVDDSCTIPHEVLTEEGVLFFGVYGTGTDGCVRTSEVLRYPIVKGVLTGEATPSDPTPEYWQQVLASVAACETAAAEAKAAAQTEAERIVGEQLAGYVTDPELAQTLQGYVSSEGLTAELDGYVSEEEQSNILKGYAKKADLPANMTDLANDGNFTQGAELAGLVRGDGTQLTNALPGVDYVVPIVRRSIPEEITPTLAIDAGDTEYIFEEALTSLTLTYPEGTFETWIKFQADDSTFKLTFPETSTFIGSSPSTFDANTYYELSIKDGVVIVAKIGDGT